MRAPPLREPEVLLALAPLVREQLIVEISGLMGGADCLSDWAAPVFLRVWVPARAGVAAGPVASFGLASRLYHVATAWRVLPPFQVRIGDGR